MSRYSWISLAIILGCGRTITQPSNPYAGLWGGTHTELEVKGNESVLRAKCLTARLPRIDPDAEGHFDVTGTVIQASWGGLVGRDHRLEGTVSGSTMTTAGWIRYDEGWAGPVVRTLTKDTEGDFSGGFCIV